MRMHKNMGVASLTVAVCFAAEAFVQILRHHGLFIQRRAPHSSILQNCNDNPGFVFLAASMTKGDLWFSTFNSGTSRKTPPDTLRLIKVQQPTYVPGSRLTWALSVVGKVIQARSTLFK